MQLSYLMTAAEVLLHIATDLMIWGKRLFHRQQSILKWLSVSGRNLQTVKSLCLQNISSHRADHHRIKVLSRTSNVRLCAIEHSSHIISILDTTKTLVIAECFAMLHVGCSIFLRFNGHFNAKLTTYGILLTMWLLFQKKQLSPQCPISY